jgi:secreted trypsin-like serine protease
MKSALNIFIIALTTPLMMVFGEEMATNMVNITSRAKNFDDFQSLVFGGESTAPGEWPFLAAMFRSNPVRFMCGATILSKDFVLTAAHCILDKDLTTVTEPIRPPEIFIYIGRYNIDMSIHEGDSVRKNVSKIIIHPEWNSTSPEYDADLAVLKLDTSITFTDKIQPISLPSSSMQNIGVSGHVVGWGSSERTINPENTPRKIHIKTIDVYDCAKHDVHYSKITSRRNFCAGGPGKAPCRGDSGGGLYVNYKGQMVILGTVSAGEIICGISDYAIFTDVTKFIGWLKATIVEDGSRNPSWNAYIYYYGNDYLCSGSLVHVKYILTSTVFIF